MKKNVSPLFALIVIVVALALGGLYFMTRYKAHEIREAQIKRALQQQAEQAMRSGRRARRMSGAPGATQRPGDPGRQGEGESGAAR
jgi:cytochrome c-type biogenesis protein CcmH/NrfG